MRPAGGDAGPVGGVVLSATSVQTGAAFGATLFPFVGPIGVVALRQVVTAIVLLAVTRPRLRSLGARRLLPAVLLGVVLVGMNLALYSAVERIGLGLAVTIEFLGPLGIALAARGTAGATVRRVLCGAVALAGVVLITNPGGGGMPDLAGMGCALAAAALWASYILLNQRAGALPGVTGTAIAGLTGTVLTLPVLIVLLAGLPADRLWQVVLVGVATGLLSSALPYSIDLLVLRHLPRQLFGMLQSVHPVAAATAGLVVLHQALSAPQLAGIAAVCAANIAALVGPRR